MVGAAISAGFDYSAVGVEDRLALEQTAARIRTSIAAMQSRAVAIGRELLEAKDRLPHGALAAWVQTELGVTSRSAQNYMNAARMVAAMPEAIRETVSLLPPATLYKLASPSTPPEIVQAAAELVAEGTDPADEIERRLAAAAEGRAAERKAKQRASGRLLEPSALIVKKLAAEAAKQEQRLAQMRDFMREMVETAPGVMLKMVEALEQHSSYEVCKALRVALAKVPGA